MKQWVVLTSCVAVLLAIGGCQRTGSGVNVIIDGNENFPPSLAGRWKDREKNWEFVFEPDGTISSAVIDSGFISVVPAKGIAEQPMRVGKAVFKLGRWTVKYSPDSRELAVEVVVDFFHVDIGKTWLEGHRTDWFIGTVSQDYQTWRADWISFPKFIAYIPKPMDLPVDPNDTVKELFFEKVPQGTN